MLIYLPISLWDFLYSLFTNIQNKLCIFLTKKAKKIYEENLLRLVRLTNREYKNLYIVL